jgi:dynein heavy chain
MIFSALAEARDIALHLKPLQRHLTALEDVGDFAEAGALLRPLMHTVCLVWAHSRYYCHSSKLIVLLRQICNLLIQQVYVYNNINICLHGNAK